MKTNAAVSLKLLDSIPTSIDGEVIVGKDILDLVAGAMYVNPLDIFREYIQNAADAIDQAKDNGLNFEDVPGISITFDQISRSVTIRDNGISIPSGEFVRRLTAVGGSNKRGTTLRGLRGVGRLSGLGYCQELIFRGRSEGDVEVSELRWDGKRLRELLRDKSFQGNLSDLIRSIVTISSVPVIQAANLPNRFFEVELCKVSRLKNDQLLNEDIVRNYLSQVAPVPFINQFTYGDDINAHLIKHGIREPISIVINDGKGQVTRNIQNQFAIREGYTDEVKGVEFLEFPGDDGEVAAIGWVCDHSYYGALPKKHGLGGIRLRSGNIQIGNETILAEFFPESRFCCWAIGEIHVISKQILPNGRRDEFEPSNHYTHLQGEFAIFAKQIAKCIRIKSEQRNRLRTVNNHLLNIQEWVSVASGQNLPLVVNTVIKEIADEKLKLAHREAEKMEANADQHTLVKAKINEIQTLLENSGINHGEGRFSEFEKAFTAAIKVILSNSTKPDDGVKLSLRVLNAITFPSTV